MVPLAALTIISAWSIQWTCCLIKMQYANRTVPYRTKLSVPRDSSTLTLSYTLGVFF
jgi:hypothetical protein